MQEAHGQVGPVDVGREIEQVHLEDRPQHRVGGRAVAEVRNTGQEFAIQPGHFDGEHAEQRRPVVLHADVGGS